MIEVTKQFRAEIAHRLPNHPGACQFIHGHSYLFEVTVAGIPHHETGMIMDFKDLKSAMEEVIGPWDHSLILTKGDDDYMIDTLTGMNGVRLVVMLLMPTAENMASYIAEWLTVKYEMNVTRVRVWETTTSYADWTAS